MKKGPIIVLLALIPFIGGSLIGYKLGVSESGGQGEQVLQDGDHAYQESNTAKMVSIAQDQTTDQISNSRTNAITKAVSSASAAVVGINVIEEQVVRPWSPWGDDPFFRNFFGDRSYTQEVQGLGSGFLISKDGYILTNDHVAGSATKITVTLTNGDKYPAQLVGTDLASDIALLKIDGKDMPYLKLGNSDDVIIGEWVIAFGNPFGLFDISDKPIVTVGVVSAMNMNLRAEGGRVYRGMIQTDASINSGNSGGPLVNSMGEVIGVNSVIFTPNRGSIGLGFAIPINRVKWIVDQLKKTGKIERNFWTGLEITPVDRRIARYFGLERVEGAIVSDVKRNSPADRGGFKVGDVILEVNGERIADDASLIAIVDDSRAGDVLRMKVWRERRVIDLPLRLEKR